MLHNQDFSQGKIQLFDVNHTLSITNCPKMHLIRVFRHLISFAGETHRRCSPLVDYLESWKFSFKHQLSVLHLNPVPHCAGIHLSAMLYGEWMTHLCLGHWEKCHFSFFNYQCTSFIKGVSFFRFTYSFHFNSLVQLAFHLCRHTPIYCQSIWSFSTCNHNPDNFIKYKI